MTDPLRKVPLYMRKELNTRKSKYYQRHLTELNQEIEGSKEDMIDFLKEQGAFFYALDEVLSTDMVNQLSLSDITEIDGKQRTDWAEAFIRTKTPDYLVQGGRSEDELVKEFKVTEAYMKTDDPIASLTSKGQSSDTKKKIWAVDIFGTLLEDVKSSEVAHLLPDEPAQAIEWYDVACWAMGHNPSTIEWEEVFRLLHGTKTGKKRVHGSGFRHFVANKTRVNLQEKLLDKNDPQMIILPVLSRKKCLDWNGEDYDAIILMGTDKNRKNYLWAADAVGMTNTNNMKASASEEELTLALALMRQMTYALVQSLVHLKPPQVPSNATDDEKQAMEEAIKTRNDRIAAFTNLMENETVQVPKQGRCLPVDEQPFRGVCKISFSNDKEKKLPLPPDPLLLVARAAVVLSVRNNYRLRASAIIAEDDYDWEQDVMQYEYLEQMARRRNLDQTTDGMEIAVADQPDDNSDDISVVSLESYSSHNNGSTPPPQREHHANSQAEIAVPKSVLCNRVENVMTAEPSE